MEERLVANQKAVGSNPRSRSNKLEELIKAARKAEAAARKLRTYIVVITTRKI